MQTKDAGFMKSISKLIKRAVSHIVHEKDFQNEMEDLLSTHYVYEMVGTSPQVTLFSSELCTSNTWMIDSGATNHMCS